MTDHDEITYVQVPEHLTTKQAEEALAECVEWLPLPGGPTDEHIGARLRAETDNGVVSTGRLARIHREHGWAMTAGGAGLQQDSVIGVLHRCAWFIHPADVQSDDDLIEAMAKALSAAMGGDWPRLDEPHKRTLRVAAHVVLAVVREHERGQS